MGQASRKKWDRAEAVREIARLNQRINELVAQLRSVTLTSHTALLELACAIKRGERPSDAELDLIISHMRAQIAEIGAEKRG